MSMFRAVALTVALAGLSACATGGTVTGQADDIAMGRASAQRGDALPETLADFRALRIDMFAEVMEREEVAYRDCPPGTIECRRRSYRRSAASHPALRGSTPWMAQITLPERWIVPGQGLLPLDNWRERHQCGGTLVAPGWVVTAAHCVDNDMVSEGWRVRVGMTNLALQEGGYFTIDRIVCFDPARCVRPPPNPDNRPTPPVYRDDIALVHFTSAPGDLVPARAWYAFEDIGVEQVQLTDDDRHLITLSEDGTRRRWEVATGAELERTDRVAEESVTRTAVGDGAFDQRRTAPDGSFFVLVTEGPCPCDVAAYDTASERLLWSISLTAAESEYDYRRGSSVPRVLEIGAGGVMVGNADEVLVLDPASGATRQSFTHPRSPAWQNRRRGQRGGQPDDRQRNFVASANFSADGRTLVTTTNRYGEADIWLWDVASGTVRQRLAQDDAPLSEVLAGAMLVQDDQRLLSWTGYGTYRLWDVASGTQVSLMRQNLPMQQMRLLRQGTVAAVFDEAGVSIWNLATGAELRRFDHLRFLHGGTISPDETQVLTWGSDGTARVWDIDQGTEVRRIYHNGDVNGAAFMTDPGAVLSWSDDGTARITRVADGTIPMIFDIGLNPTGSALALPLDQRPAQGVEVDYLPLAGSSGLPIPVRAVGIYGWGKTQAPGGFDPYASLMQVDLLVLANADCADLPGMEGRERVHPNVFCARDPHQKTCQGDSGGPVVQDGALVGVVSWGKKNCTYDGEPGVYTRIGAFSDWIRSQVGEGAIIAAPPAVAD